MTLQEIINIDIRNKSVLILGRAGSGKSYLSELLMANPIHTDEYLPLGEQRAIQCVIEDEYCLKGSFKNTVIVEGMLGYSLLLLGLKEKSYLPNIIIICEMSAGTQRKVYLAERDPAKLKYQQRFFTKCQGIMNECFKEMSKLPKEDYPDIYIFQNEYEPNVIEKQD